MRRAASYLTPHAGSMSCLPLASRASFGAHSAPGARASSNDSRPKLKPTQPSGRVEVGAQAVAADAPASMSLERVLERSSELLSTKMPRLSKVHDQPSDRPIPIATHSPNHCLDMVLADTACASFSPCFALQPSVGPAVLQHGADHGAAPIIAGRCLRALVNDH